MFNPEELTFSKSVDWQAKTGTAGHNAPSMEFKEGGSASMSLDLIFDTTDTGSPVTGYTNTLLELMEVNDNLPSSDAPVKRPPWVKFHWADFHSFKAYVQSASITFTYFSSSGLPLRAKANLSLQQLEDDPTWLAQNPTSGTPDPHRIHVFQVGDSLDQLASRYYNDPTRWRVLAEVNDVDDPLRISPGTRLAVPLAAESSHA
jgi:hypothetical protein